MAALKTGKVVISGDFWKKQTVIHEMVNGRGLTVISACVNKKDEHFVDVRNWVYTEASGGYIPTQKGVTVPADKLDEFVQALVACLD